MGVMIGFVLGYVFGARAGKEGLAELESAWRTISSSEEMKDIAAGMLSVVRDVTAQGAGTLARRLASAEDLGEMIAA